MEKASTGDNMRKCIICGRILRRKGVFIRSCCGPKDLMGTKKSWHCELKVAGGCIYADKPSGCGMYERRRKLETT